VEPLVQQVLGGNKTKSTPFIRGGVLFFQRTDNKLWHISSAGAPLTWLNGYKMKSTLFVNNGEVVFTTVAQ
jgi:hypothetical protein